MPNRLGIVARDKCKPDKCRLECKTNCPVVRIGKLCIEIDLKNSVAEINENLCIGCGICVKKCPYKAIEIVQFPQTIEELPIYKYGKNCFQLFRLPSPKQGKILGIIGSNGIGKSTALKILSGNLAPNFGNVQGETICVDLKKYFRGKLIHKYLESITKRIYKVLMKPQYIDTLQGTIKGKIGDILNKKKEREDSEKIIKELNLKDIIDRDINNLSGGELQRLSIALMAVQNCNVMIIDEMSSYLDLKQKLKVSKLIRNRIDEDPDLYVLLSEHDLSIIDYLSDNICCMFGIPGAFGIVSVPYPTNDGINIFLSGHLPKENLKFRNSIIDFSKLNSVSEKKSIQSNECFSYPSMEKKFNSFHLVIESGEIYSNEILVLLGENGTGKSTYLKIISGFIRPEKECLNMKTKQVSYKPQKISPSFCGTVEELLDEKLGKLTADKYFMQNILSSVNLTHLGNKKVNNLSGGEVQKLAIILCLAKNAQIYVLDEPSAYLDVEQRIEISKVLKNFSKHYCRSVLIVEHDFTMAAYLADRVVLFSGKPGKKCTAKRPMVVNNGFNLFLEELGITFRKDEYSNRPRINKKNSIKDLEQKKMGKHIF